METVNLFDTDLLGEPGSVRVRQVVKEVGGELLGGMVWELPPLRTSVPYHSHHGNEELLIVLGGTATVRDRYGETELEAGDIAVFPSGDDGAHQILNRDPEDTCRYIVVSTMNDPDVISLPDTDKVRVLGRYLRGEHESSLWEDEPNPFSKTP